MFAGPAPAAPPSIPQQHPSVSTTSLDSEWPWEQQSDDWRTKEFTLDGDPFPSLAHPSQPSGRRAIETPEIGTVRSWVGLNMIDDDVYRKDYTLRGIGEHIEVWVAKDIAFPEGDCRGTSVTEITDAQVTGLMHEFDKTIYPKETAAFSTPPDRNGTNAGLPGDFTGAGNRTVTLVDNVRDENYFDYPKRQTYISGFFS
ncbi:MAG TPA: peptidase M6 immune inhibitor A, partial [Actinoplanes sp.]|nr:peptidase M6 immune inhibitor A [Actinoplanes sp.]